MVRAYLQQGLLVYVLLTAKLLFAQTTSILPTTPVTKPANAGYPSAAGTALPNSPGATAYSDIQDVVAAAEAGFARTGDSLPAVTGDQPAVWDADPHPNLYRRLQRRRALYLAPQQFLDESISIPMNSREKAFVAVTDVSDQGNLAVIALSSAVYTASSSHSSYGPGLKGFGRNYGYSLTQDATGEFFGTWLIPSIARQDVRYHRMPGAPLRKRIFHAVAHTVVSQSDAGETIPNYATLLTYPIAAEIANLYVPGLHTNGPSTAKRVVIGLASDPSDALIGEFLPDLARRIHIRVTFFQQVINDISTEHPM